MLNLFINNIISLLNQQGIYKKILSLLSLKQYPINIIGAKGGFLSLIIAHLFQQAATSCLVITPTEKEASSIRNDLFIFTGKQNQVELFPYWHKIPYGQVSVPVSVFADRMKILSSLLLGTRRLIVTSIRALLHPLPHPDESRKQIISLELGDTLNIQKLAAQLNDYGYLRVPRVSIKGEYALRGEVLDVFVPGNDLALRIGLEYDKIETLKYFNPVTQLSTSTIKQSYIFPLTEAILSQEHIKTFTENMKSQAYKKASINELIDRLKSQSQTVGIENYTPLFFKQTSSLLDYLPTGSPIFLINSDQLANSAISLKKEYNFLYKQARAEGGIVPKPGSILLDYRRITGNYPVKIAFPLLEPDSKQDKVVRLNCDAARSFFGNIRFFKEELANLIRSGYTVYIFADYQLQAERIKHLIKDFKVSILGYRISSGFSLPDLRIAVIEENEIFSRKKRIPRSIKKAASTPIDSFIELDVDDYIVHMQYGIGLFKGIERVTTLGLERDYIKLEYAEKEIIFIPIEQVNLIERYIAQGGGPPRMDRIGGKIWESKKKRVKKSVTELANRLLRLYSLRKKAPGYKFSADTQWQEQFEVAFPYEETQDQLKCIVEVKQDMESGFPMDRLICGDVGYGKTEIALRAAFKAVMDGKQVAILAPTTILVEQHFETFVQRFTQFPVTIYMLSRFVERAEQKKIIKGLQEGKVDIVIGTHRLVQRDVHFKNLGLLVVDEEQRFGVRHKERIKEFKTSVDCLTLTATPIPRTLYMSLMKLRDISILNTPPENRLPIKTFIQEFNEDIVRQTILKEVHREGQVFFLHNRIQTIDRVFSLLRELVPEVTLAVAHGRMDNEELEDVMHGFIRGDFHVLLSTTIIENGIDIPNVNTIIIDRADMFGVSQLYQLRGRVGRSDVPAYAYLLYPEKRALSEVAMKRLQIISDNTELGSGFKIALKDLEMRGAGNLLGKEQHGDIQVVGFSMYLRLLDKAIANLEQEAAEEEAPEPILELEYTGFIPDSYIKDMMEKMEVYKRIVSVSTESELDQVYQELEDRFGSIPDEVQSILSLPEIRIICKKLFVSSLKEREGKLTVEFSRLAKISADKVVRLIKLSGGSVYLDKHRPNCLVIKTGNIGLKEKSEFIRDRLGFLL